MKILFIWLCLFNSGALISQPRGFIWGVENGHLKVSQIKWDIVCVPKNQGGLGFRKTSDLNQAMIMKSGWGLVSKPGSLY